MREAVASIEPLHLSDLVRFLKSSGRDQTCPFCRYDGGWDFHIQLPESDTDIEEDPLLCVYTLSLSHDKIHQECTAITCPKCAHFSMLDITTIKLHKHNWLAGQVLNNG